QGTWGTQGNFELLVPMGDHVAHFWRDNDSPGFPWHRNPDLPRAGAFTLPPGTFVVTADPVGVAFLQGNFIPAPGAHGNFEVVVRLRPRLPGKDYLAFYYFDSAEMRWHGPLALEENGAAIDGVTGF